MQLEVLCLHSVFTSGKSYLSTGKIYIDVFYFYPLAMKNRPKKNKGRGYKEMDGKQRESTVQQPRLNLPPYHCFTRGKHAPKNRPTGFSPPKTHSDHRSFRNTGISQGGRKEKNTKKKPQELGRPPSTKRRHYNMERTCKTSSEGKRSLFKGRG